MIFYSVKMYAAAVMIVSAASLSVTGTGIEPQTVFTGRTGRAFSTALSALGITTEAYTFDKVWDTDEFRLPIVNDCLSNPLKLITWTDGLYEDCRTADYKKVLGTVTGIKPAGHISGITNQSAALRQILSIQAALQNLYNDSIPAISQKWLYSALLLRSAQIRKHRMASEEILRCGAEPALVRQTLEEIDSWIYADEDIEYRIVSLLKQIPVETVIAEAYTLLALAREAAGLDWNEADRDYWREYGICIGTVAADTYTNTDAWCIIDPGGDDVYGVSTGFAANGAGKPVCMIIDTAGNDRYEGSRYGGAGGAMLGVSIMVDTSGNDRYSGGTICQGSAVGGAAIVFDADGTDYYHAEEESQGFGYFGLGCLIDHSGNDIYDISSSGQGYGYVKGYGVLYDRAGNDVYIAGRGDHDAGRYNDRYISISQGVGMGMRPYASGGIGLLADIGGNDVYSADVFGQGVGYWYGLGMLIDCNGADTYHFYEYGQGAGVHLACGALLDGNGNDVYTARNGIAQGVSHDFAIGLLRDYAGDDQYQGRVTVQGSSINNGVGFLIEEQGNDWYSSLSDVSQGFGRFEDRRDFGSMGMCLDAAGDDFYHDQRRNGFIDIRGLQGIGIDYQDETDHETE